MANLNADSVASEKNPFQPSVRTRRSPTVANRLENTGKRPSERFEAEIGRAEGPTPEPAGGGPNIRGDLTTPDQFLTTESRHAHDQQYDALVSNPFPGFQLQPGGLGARPKTTLGLFGPRTGMVGRRKPPNMHVDHTPAFPPAGGQNWLRPSELPPPEQVIPSAVRNDKAVQDQIYK